MEAVTGEHIVLKTRLKHLLSKDDSVRRIQHAVATMNDIVTRALVFGKLLYLHDLDACLSDNDDKFDASVAGAMCESYPIDASQLEEWMDVVSTTVATRRGRPYAAGKKEHMERLHAFYSMVAAQGLLPSVKVSCINLSNPKGHAAAQMATNYRTNVHCHFDKYVRRFVQMRLTALARSEHGINPEDRLPVAVKIQLKADIRAVCNDILQSSTNLSCREALRPWVRQHLPLLMPPLAGPPSPHWRFRNQEQHPERWLPYMVMMNRWIEADGGKLFSPLLQRTSFVPAHIRLDTVGLIDLLVPDAAAALQLRKDLEKLDMPPDAAGRALKYDLPKLVGKGNLYEDLVKLVSPELTDMVKADPTRQGAAFRTGVWKCLTKLESDQHVGVDHLGKIFNNVIDTDGFSVSLHYVDPVLHGATRFNGNFKLLKASQKAQAAAGKALGATYITSIPEPERQAMKQRVDAGLGKLLALDPGKGMLAVVTDGTKVVRYSAAQRRVESRSKAFAKEHRRLLAVGGHDLLLRAIGQVPGQPDDVRRSPKSCNTEHYQEYLDSRNAVADRLYAFYGRTVFRRHRYDAHIGRKSSEDRFASRIKAAFGDVEAVLYGDWGRHPNLRNQPPSPGVGLRRRLCSHFKVLLVHEAYTSSVCPRCEGRDLVHPRTDANGDDVHHLLKCQKPTCPCPWWHRDILGSLNILKTGKAALETGRWHPVFSAAAA